MQFEKATIGQTRAVVIEDMLRGLDERIGHGVQRCRNPYCRRPATTRRGTVPLCDDHETDAQQDEFIGRQRRLREQMRSRA